MLSDGATGYIGIGEEEIPDMASKMANALADLRSLGATRLVMDMRGNDGGDDEQVLDILKFFQPPDSPVRVYERASYSNRLLSIAKGGSLRKYMNLTGLGLTIDPTAFGVVDEPAGGAYGVLHSGPMDEDDPVWATVPSDKREFSGPWLGPVVCMINRYCDSSCEGIARGFAQLEPGRAAVTGFEGTLGSFGMDGGTVVLPGDTTFAVPYGRSLDASGTIQIDSDWTGAGGILPTARLARNRTNMLRFVAARLATALSDPSTGASGRFDEDDDVELDWALSVLDGFASFPSFRGSRLITDAAAGDTLNAWAGKHKDQEWALCCSTFEGCDTAAKFHAACDAHTPTLTVGHNSRHFTFGGFVRTLSLVSLWHQLTRVRVPGGGQVVRGDLLRRGRQRLLPQGQRRSVRRLGNHYLHRPHVVVGLAVRAVAGPSAALRTHWW